MKRRIFIALNLEENIKKEIRKDVDGFKKTIHKNVLGSFRFLNEAHWHITVSFLGYQEDAAIPRITSAVQRTAENFSAPTITFEHVAYGPTPRAPRLVWLKTDGHASESLSKIKRFLEDELEKERVPFKREMRTFRGHVTLVRFDLARSALPPFDKTVFLNASVPYLDVMESHLTPKGAEYTVRERHPFRV